jgi:ribonuclease HI
MIVNLYVDAAVEKNPGPGGIGIVISDENKKTLYEIKEYIGDNVTNNVAEYRGVIRGLQEAKKRGAKQVNVFMDSLLVINQLKEEYAVRDKALREQFMIVKKLERLFESVNYQYIPRKENKRANKLAYIALSHAKLSPSLSSVSPQQASLEKDSQLDIG